MSEKKKTEKLRANVSKELEITRQKASLLEEVIIVLIANSRRDGF